MSRVQRVGRAVVLTLQVADAFLLEQALDEYAQEAHRAARNLRESDGCADPIRISSAEARRDWANELRAELIP